MATQGTLSEDEFNEEIPFYYFDKYIYIDVVINDKTYPFLFDTGWDVTHVDAELLKEVDFSPLKKYTTDGSSFEEVKLQYGTLNSTLTIGNIDFGKMGVGIQDLSFIDSTFPDKRKIFGVIGTNVFRKAVWQIDYKEQVIRFSSTINSFPPESSDFEVQLIPKNDAGWGGKRIKATMNGVTENFVFDTGSYGSFSANNEFLERLEKADKPLIENSRAENGKRIFAIESLQLDSIEFANQELLIEEGINSLIGNDFLEGFTVTIDWLNNKIYLKENVALD